MHGFRILCFIINTRVAYDSLSLSLSLSLCVCVCFIDIVKALEQVFSFYSNNNYNSKLVKKYIYKLITFIIRKK